MAATAAVWRIPFEDNGKIMILLWQSGCYVPGLPSRLAEHAVLQPTGKPLESSGPFKAAGPESRLFHMSVGSWIKYTNSLVPNPLGKTDLHIPCC